MLTILMGDDIDLIANYKSSIKKQYKSSEITLIDTDIGIGELKDLIFAKSLFSVKKLVILTPKKNSQLGFNQEEIELMVKDTQIEILIDVTPVKKNTKEYKAFAKLLKTVKNVSIKTFNIQKSFATFKFADELFINKNKIAALKILETLTDDELYMLVGSISYQLRTYVAVKYQNEFSKTIKLFVKNKFTRVTYDESKLKTFYTDLFNLDVKSKSENTKIKNLIIDYVINTQL